MGSEEVMIAFSPTIQTRWSLRKIFQCFQRAPHWRRGCSRLVNRNLCSSLLSESWHRREFVAALLATLIGSQVSGVRNGCDKAGGLAAAEVVKESVSGLRTEAETSRLVADAVYSAPNEKGVCFRYPSGWRVRTKPIKTHAFEVLVVSDGEPSTSIGVVSDSVRIERIEDFGAARDIGERVVALERKKDGVISAELVQAVQYPSQVQSPLTYYLCEYRVNSTRGGERHYAAKVTITGKQLYVMTVQCKENQWEKYAPLFREVLDSFEVRSVQT
jgi:hypothetical protein